MFRQVVVIEGSLLRPSSCFTCQKKTIILVNAIATACVAISLVISVGKILSNEYANIPFHLFAWLYLHWGIKGARQESECLFTVLHLGINLLGTLSYTAGAIYFLVVVMMKTTAAESSSSDSSSSSNNSSSSKGNSSLLWEVYGGFADSSTAAAAAESILPPVVASIAWTAFLIVFARNLHRWNRQKRAARQEVGLETFTLVSGRS